MSGRSFITRPVLCSIFLLVSSGCSHVQNMRKPPEKEPKKECVYVNNLKPEDYPEEISEKLAIVENHQEKDVKACARIQLAHLYSSGENPKRSNKKAIEQLEKYIASVTEANVQYNVKNWLDTLRDIERLKQKTTSLNARIRDLKRENKALGNTVGKLREENQNLNGKIEKLKTLEIMHEEKRKKYR